MAAAFDSSSRSWWSMARSQSGPVTGYSPEKPKSKSKSKTLNTLFGLKSKKNPAVAIQDPPLPIQPVPPEHIPQSFANRPPSKSVSSVISRADSFGPRTPSDFQPLDRNPGRQSLLTLSDVDPFASSRSIGTVSSPYQPTDPTRLSAYSNTSSNDHIHRKNVDLASQQRTSYASSSSQSQNHVNGPESPLPLSPPPALHPTLGHGAQWE
ncbi:hypothetical protein EST38_g6679 [Candolleomyces aberdarensis]|uniref:Uncharacterized protein n=1 Tax=Candolleomyces aberdarensis TaxID=2316362 RepID=A0A4Q2DJ11_9AGAR|nr:hypothetical protein EST38_g6679 [Candolleomyces aberdarensis]